VRPTSFATTVSNAVGFSFFFQAEDGIRDRNVTGVQTCALPISYCKSCRTTPEGLHASFRKNAEKRLRSVLAAKAISEAEGIVAHTDEVNAEYRRLAAQHNAPEAEIRKVLSPDAVAAALVAQKVEAFLLANAQVTSVTDPAPRTAAQTSAKEV